MGRWEEIPVTADVAVEVEGENLKDLLLTAAEAMISLMFGHPAVAEDRSEVFDTSGEDMEALLVNFLSDLLYVVETKSLVPAKIELVNTGRFSFRAKVTGERFDPEKHTLECEIKAPTYHNLFVKKENGRLRCRILFDV